MKKDFFINAISMVSHDGSVNVPTAIYYSSGQHYIGTSAYQEAGGKLVNEEFKVELGRQDPSIQHRRQFETGSGQTRSAHALAKDFIDELVKVANSFIARKGLAPASLRILVAEPIAMGEREDVKESWLSNYRAHIKRILGRKFTEIDFLPEPFAVFQYYRYGLRHPLVGQQARYIALVLDFGGGTFDVSVIETTAKGDISQGGRNSKPLSASSLPIGGFRINREIAEELLLELLAKGVDKAGVKKAIKAFEDLRGASEEELSEVRADYRHFVGHYRRFLNDVERVKILLCNSVVDWSPDATYSVVPRQSINVPSSPLSANGGWVSVSFDAYRLRVVFEKRVWPHLKSAILRALDNAASYLGGKPVSVVLLSGGSSNIKWLTELIRRDLTSRLEDAQLVELQENYQEIVAKGLAIECARRTFGEGHGDFRSVTYNPVYLALEADSREMEWPRFKLVGEIVGAIDREAGMLLPSAADLAGSIDSALKWKFRVKHPPRRMLHYFFGSGRNEDVQAAAHNVDHRIDTPKDARFDANLFIELAVSPDGTTYPKFVYSKAGPSSKEVAINGHPFYMDMTYGTRATVGEAYFGLDFGSSNSSISFVDKAAVKSYSDRGTDVAWLELNDLVGELPFAAAAPLAGYITARSAHEQEALGREALEGMLAVAAYLAFSELRTLPSAKHSNRFKGFTQRSAGPLWALLRETLSALGNSARFSQRLRVLISESLFKEIDAAISAISDEKHGKGSHRVDYLRLLGVLGNALHRGTSNLLFGSFESVAKRSFSTDFVGGFRIARGSSQPFVTFFQYSGPHCFSDAEVYVWDKHTKKMLSLFPLILWLPEETSARVPSNRMCLFDRIERKSQVCSFKVAGAADSVRIGPTGDLTRVSEALQALTQRDEGELLFDGVTLTSVELEDRLVPHSSAPTFKELRSP